MIETKRYYFTEEELIRALLPDVKLYKAKMRIVVYGRVYHPEEISIEVEQ